MKKVFKNKGNEEVTLTDGRKVWLSRASAVVAVVFGIYKDSIYVLTEKRSETMQDAPGKWAIPSGYLDWNESGFDGIRRELYEETGFDVDQYEYQLIFDHDQQPWFVNTDPLENRQNISLSYILIYNFDNNLPKEVELFKNSEISEAKWMPLENVITPEKQWAFNHDIRVEMATNKFIKYLL